MSMKETATWPREFLMKRVSTQGGAQSKKASRDAFRNAHQVGDNSGDTVNDAGVVQGIGENHVVRTEQGTEQSGVGGKARVEKQRRFRASKRGEFGFQLVP